MSMLADLKVLQRGPMWPAPMQAAAKHKPTLFGRLAMERWVFFSRAVPANLKSIAQIRASTMVGCTW